MSFKISLNHCETCQISKYNRNMAKPKCVITSTPIRPMEIVHINTLPLNRKNPYTL